VWAPDGDLGLWRGRAVREMLAVEGSIDDGYLHDAIERAEKEP